MTPPDSASDTVDSPPIESAPASGAESPAAVRRVGRAGVIWRSVLLLAGVLLVVRGSVWGNDVDWPFGPMSQFAFRVGHDDAIRSTFLEARDAGGTVMIVPLTARNIGIARAEIEGQQPAFVRQPSLLSALASNYHERHPDAPGLTQLWLGEHVTALHNGREAGTTTDTLVGWPENSTAPEVAP
jgi:hypothetical protein